MPVRIEEMAPGDPETAAVRFTSNRGIFCRALAEIA